MERKILFCNVAYMKCYDKINFPDDIPKHAGKYVNDTKDAYEKNNFHIWEDGYCYGFVETGLYKDEKPKQLDINKISNSKSKDEYVEGITVVFCALSDLQKKTVIVGWYNNATVYRNRQFTLKKHMYNIKARSEDVVLLSESDRIVHIPRARIDGIGFGQSQIWYANSEKAKEFRLKIIQYVETYNEKLEMPVYQEKDENDKVTYLENATGKTITIKQYERNQGARKACLKRKGTRCSICDLSFSDTYGECFSNIIEVHHIKPISKQEGAYIVNPDVDLVPLCPNCHTAIHKKINGKELTLEELKSLYENRRGK